MKLHILSDNSGYYFSAFSSRQIWKYLFKSPQNTLCQLIPNINFRNIDLKISDTSFFIIGQKSYDSRMQMSKITFGNTSPDWANYLSCPKGYWKYYSTESVQVSKYIYSFFLYGLSNNQLYLYLASMSSVDGLVSALRYKSNSYIYNLIWSEASGSNIILVGQSIDIYTPYVLIYSTETEIFTIRNILSGDLSWLTIDSGTGR